MKYYKRSATILWWFQDLDKLYKDHNIEPIVDEETGETFYRATIHGEVLDFDRNDYLQILAEEGSQRG